MSEDVRPQEESDKEAPPRATPADRMPPDHVGVLIAAAVLMMIGWGGLYRLIVTTLPRVGQRWLFFLLLQIAATGTAIPIVRYLNVRFTPMDAELPPGGVLVRQSLWVGLFVVAAAWLRIPRVLTLPIAFSLAVSFIVIEAFLRFRERQNEERRDE